MPSLGEHQGAYGFTVGQRKGLRVGTPAGDGRPRYVLDIEPVTRTVTVGPAEGLDITEITATRPVWTGCAPPPQPVDCQVQLRAHGEVHACTAGPDGDAVRIRLHHPARGVAKGQAAVLYDGGTVLGSATISGTAAAPRSPRSPRSAGFPPQVPCGKRALTGPPEGCSWLFRLFMLSSRAEL